MTKQEQSTKLLRWLSDPCLKSGIYLFDTDLNDEEIKKSISNLDEYAYYEEPLFTYSSESSVFELLTIGLCSQINSKEIESLKNKLFNADANRKDMIVYSLWLSSLKVICQNNKAILHLKGELDLTIISHEELSLLNSSIDHNNKITIIFSKIKVTSAETDRQINKISLNNKSMEERIEKVHITYKHNNQHKDAVDAIIRGVEKYNIDFSIDEYDILYRDNILEYEQKIGRSHKLILFVIPEYLKSLACMYEMTEIFRNGNIKERVYPLVDLGSIPRNGDGLKQVKDFWSTEKNRKAEQIKNESGGSKFILDELEKIDNILKYVDDFWNFIVNTNSSQYENLIANDAEILMHELMKQTVIPDIDEKFVPSDETQPAIVQRRINQGEKSVYIEKFNGTINID